MRVLPPSLTILILIALVSITSFIAMFGVWNWQRLLRKVITPLSQQPELMIPTKERLAEKGMVGKEAVFRRIPR